MNIINECNIQSLKDILKWKLRHLNKKLKKLHEGGLHKKLKNMSRTTEVKSDYFFYHNVLYNFIPFNTKKINLVWYIINDVILW